MSGNSKALVAMSGGVDSAVSALLLRDMGYDCIGATMKLFEKKPELANDDIADARAVAERIGIPHRTFDYSREFSSEVIKPFVDAYLNGDTPNPCIFCNRSMKFGRLLSEAEKLGASYIATGHYARIKQDGAGKWQLYKAVDKNKDQSYVLYNLTQSQLSSVLLPLGGLTKDEVRAIAEKNGFSNAHRRESQDICFVPDGDYGAFIERQVGTGLMAGNFVLKDGTVLGAHKGLYRYTVGQRRGLGIAWKHSLFVTEKRICDNSVVLGGNDELFSQRLTAHNINLIAADRLDNPIHISARVRYNQPEQPATVIQTSEDELTVEFDAPQRAVTCGQAVVFYDGDIVIGGGIIKSVL